MQINSKWTSLLAGLAMLGGAISPVIADESFNLWQECATRCNLELAEGVRYSQLDLSGLIDEQADSGVLHYSMVLGEGGNNLKLGIDAAVTLRSNDSTITLTSTTADNHPRTFSYTRQSNGAWSLHWLVPVGDDAPSSIKVFFHELDAGSEVSHISPIYSIEVSDAMLHRMAKNPTLIVKQLSKKTNQNNPILTLSSAGVGFVAAPTRHSRQKRWSEWHTGKVLCLLDPLDAFYNALSQRTCNLSDTWEGQVYRVLAGSPASHDTQTIPTAIAHRIQFTQPIGLASLIAHQTCAIPMESLTRARKPRGWEELNLCGYPVIDLVLLYQLTRLSWSLYDTVITQALSDTIPADDSNPSLEDMRDNPAQARLALSMAIRDNPDRARLALSMAAAQYGDYNRQSGGNSQNQAARADVVTLTCPAADLNCLAPSGSANALQERDFPNGASFLGEGGEVSFSTTGTRNWSIDRLIEAHAQLLASGYTFVGYHGTFLEAANSIVFGGVRERDQSSIAPWQGFYIATDPALAYGYAQDQEAGASGRIRNGVLLRVYVPRTALPHLYATQQTLADPGAVDAVSRLIGHPLPLQLEAITGPEEEGGRLETILGWRLAEQAVVIPSAIPTDPRNIGSDLDPEIVLKEESDISVPPDYVTRPHDEL